MPSWTEREDAFARSLQKQVGAPRSACGFPPTVSKDRRCRSRRQMIVATCRGRCRWGGSGFRARCHLPFHHWTAGAPLATSIAHKGGLAGAKALAASAIEFFQDNTLVAETKASFGRELAGTVYRPLLPEDQRAPAHLNLALMEKFRPQMEAHYLRDEPVFATP